MLPHRWETSCALKHLAAGAGEFPLRINHDLERRIVTMAQIHFGFTEKEWKTLRRLDRPERIQRFLDEDIGYDVGESGPRCRFPRSVLRERLAACMDGALFGAAALRA